jgi:ArsR family transcriptional regulator
MKTTAKLFGLFSDETRLRILMLLGRGELCVCHLMAVLGVSQPLVSRNLSLLGGAGLVGERRQGKLVFYSLRRDMPQPARKIMKIVRDEVKDDPVFSVDLESLVDCNEFLRKAGACDMKTFLAFMEQRRKKRKA